MKLKWTPDKEISFGNRIFWIISKPAFYWIDFCSKISGNGQKYTIDFHIGD